MLCSILFEFSKVSQSIWFVLTSPHDYRSHVQTLSLTHTALAVASLRNHFVATLPLLPAWPSASWGYMGVLGLVYGRCGLRGRIGLHRLRVPKRRAWGPGVGASPIGARKPRQAAGARRSLRRALSQMNEGERGGDRPATLRRLLVHLVCLSRNHVPVHVRGPSTGTSVG